MIRQGVMLLAVLVSACGGKADKAGTDSTAVAAAVVDTTPDGMPVFPEASSGQLALNSVPRGDLSGVWRAQAAICERPPFLQVQGGETGFKALVALAIPPEATARVTKYPVVYADSGMPAPPAAQMAIQLVTDKGVFQFQAREGEIDVQTFGRNVSGRISVKLREIATEEVVHVTGVLNAVPVQSQSTDYCDKLAAAAKH